MYYLVGYNLDLKLIVRQQYGGLHQHSVPHSAHIRARPSHSLGILPVGCVSWR